MTNQIKSDFDKIVKKLKLPKKNIDLRKKNLDKFINLGFPNKREEEWKFSDLNKIISSNIKDLKYFNKELFNEEKKSIIPKDVLPYKLFEHNKIVITNGVVDIIDFKPNNILHGQDVFFEKAFAGGLYPGRWKVTIVHPHTGESDGGGSW